MKIISLNGKTFLAAGIEASANSTVVKNALEIGRVDEGALVAYKEAENLGNLTTITLGGVISYSVSDLPKAMSLKLALIDAAFAEAADNAVKILVNGTFRSYLGQLKTGF